jgi:hypothetical protein
VILSFHYQNNKQHPAWYFMEQTFKQMCALWTYTGSAWQPCRRILSIWKKKRQSNFGTTLLKGQLHISTVPKQQASIGMAGMAKKIQTHTSSYVTTLHEITYSFFDLHLERVGAPLSNGCYPMHSYHPW